jgi:uncharacterized protein
MLFLKRNIQLSETLKKKSVLLLGPRRSGKSALVRNQIKPDLVIDLLKADQFQKYSFRPSLLRENLKKTDRLVVIDEVQKLPALLDEVHAMIEETPVRFVLTGSSARKLKRTHTALLAGRTRRLNLHPFSYSEVADRFKLKQYLQRGGLPPVFLAESDKDAWAELADYTGDYLREEIQAEAIVRRIEAFSRFLPIAARMNGQLLRYEAVASDAQVPARTVREYFNVLEDTLVGQTLQPLRLKGSNARKATATGKFYFFDCGVVNALVGRRDLANDSNATGELFETWIYSELRAYSDYTKERDATELLFWRSPNQQEVDFLINREVAIEVKLSQSIGAKHLSGLHALAELIPIKHKIVVCNEPTARIVDDIEILPWRIFVERLWSGQIF